VPHEGGVALEEFPALVVLALHEFMPRTPARATASTASEQDVHADHDGYQREQVERASKAATCSGLSPTT
jgi:hypothetical protein